MSSSFLLGRFDETLTDSAGTALPSVNIEVRRQGATVNGAQAGTSPLTVTVDDRGAIEASDTVAIDAGTTTYNVDSKTATTIVLSGFAGTLSLTDDQRITPTNNLPTLYVDVRGDETLANPAATSVAGRVEAWMAGGFYDYKLSGGGVVAELRKDYHVATLGPVIEVTKAPYFAKFDGTTDDTVAIRRATLDALLSSGPSSSGGAVVLLPPGVAIISSTINVGEASGVTNVGRVILRGAGRRTTTLKASAGFSFNGTTDAVLRIGAGLGANMHDVVLDAFTIDCNNVSGSIGVYSTNCQEGSRPQDIVVNNFKVKGMFFSGSGCQNFTIRSCETYHTATTAVGLDLNACGSMNTIDDVTVNSNNATQSTNPGIRITGCNVHLRRIHPEYHDKGILFTGGATGFVEAAYGHSTVVTVVEMDDPGVGCVDIMTASSTNAIKDNSTGGATLTVAGFSGLGGNFYFHPLDTPIGGVRTVFGSSQEVANWLNGTFRFTNTVTMSGAVTMSGTTTASGRFLFGPQADVASGATVALPATGNYSRITGNTNVDTITATVSGHLIILEGTSSVVLIRDTSAAGGNIHLGSDTGKSLGTNDCLLLLCDGTIWKQVAAQSDN